MLAIEVSEIGATLITLSVPGAKRMVKHVFGKGVGRRIGDVSPGVALDTCKPRPQHSMLDLENNGAHYEASVSAASRRSVNQPEEGIRVTVDIHVERPEQAM